MAPLRYRRGLLTVLPFLTLGLLGRPIRQRATDHTLRAVVGLVLLVQLWAPVAAAQVVGDRVLLVERALGIPGHPAPGNNAVSYRFPGGTAVAIRAIDTATGWFRVEDDTAHSAWITRT
jgi:hypothetical protein